MPTVRLRSADPSKKVGYTAGFYVQDEPWQGFRGQGRPRSPAPHRQAAIIKRLAAPRERTSELRELAQKIVEMIPADADAPGGV
jgi:hypothetical protein